jgi:Na+/alanine symporter
MNLVLSFMETSANLVQRIRASAILALVVLIQLESKANKGNLSSSWLDLFLLFYFLTLIIVIKLNYNTLTLSLNFSK